MVSSGPQRRKGAHLALPAHPEEIRDRALELLRQPGATLRGVAQQTGVRANVLQRWAKVAGIQMTCKGGRPPKEREMKAEERVTKEILATIQRVGAEVRAGEIRSPQVGTAIRADGGRQGEIVEIVAASDSDKIVVQFATGEHHEVVVHDGDGEPDPLHCEWEREPGEWDRLLITDAEMEAMLGGFMNAAKRAAGERPAVRGPRPWRKPGKKR